MFGRRSVPRLLVLLAATVALVLAYGASAFAGPSDPILSFSDLRSELSTAPSGQLAGYMKTVVKGSDITTIPLMVTGVPLAGGPDTDLIMFEATGSLIAKYGGVVAGMSGSPIYVNDGGVDKLVGAVSYGDYFTLGGTGLATPIEAMTHLEDNYATKVVPLSSPIITSGGVVNQIIVAPDPQDYAGAAKTGAFVAKPLASVFIGGLKPSSTGYKALAKDLNARGIPVVSLNSPLVSGGGDESAFSIEMTSGASIAALAARGDMWVGGVGTVTYVDSDTVLAFGHPAYWTGASSLYMANAWVQGIWPSSYEPYKVADPGKIKGAITQDRGAGILGKTGTFPTETTITAEATNVDTHEQTSSAVYVPRQLFINGFADGSLAAESAYIAGSRLFDEGRQPGSAHTTTTVEVADKHDNHYEIVIPNYTDSTYDIAYDSVNDVYNSVASLQSVLAWGIDDPKILSIDVTGEYSPTRAGATIVGVDAPNGVHEGANRIQVQAIVYGMDDTQTVDATLTVPHGTALGGSITAAALDSSNSDDMSSIFTDDGLSLNIDSSGGRESIAQIADDLNHTLPNTTIQITFQPQITGGSDFTDPSQMPSTDPISVNATAPWPMTSYANVGVTTVNAFADPSVIAYGDFSDIVGDIDGPSKPTTVTLYATPAGGAETTVATQMATLVDGDLEFDFPVDGITTNTRYRVHVGSTDSWTAADGSVLLRVRAIVSLSASASHIKPGKSVTLKATVFPTASPGGTVVFEQLVGKSWRKIASKGLVNKGSFSSASTTWKPGNGSHKVRMRYLGGAKNYAATSSIKTISVK